MSDDLPIIGGAMTMEVARLEREIAALRGERDRVATELDATKVLLRWYVENDDTNEGGKCEESNAPWLEKKRAAMRLLGMEG